MTRIFETKRPISSICAPYKSKGVVLGAASLFMTAAGLLLPAITRWIVDEVLVPNHSVSPERRLQVLGKLLSATSAIHFLSWGAEWIHRSTAAWLGARIPCGGLTRRRVRRSIRAKRLNRLFL